MRRHIARHYGTCSDYRAFADSDIRQDDAVRPDKDVLFNYNFSIAGGSSGSRVKMGDYRCSEADRAIVSDRHFRRMYFINVHKLANPDVLSDHYSPQPVQPRSQTESSRRQKSYSTH